MDIGVSLFLFTHLTPSKMNEDGEGERIPLLIDSGSSRINEMGGGNSFDGRRDDILNTSGGCDSIVSADLIPWEADFDESLSSHRGSWMARSLPWSPSRPTRSAQLQPMPKKQIRKPIVFTPTATPSPRQSRKFDPRTSGKDTYNDDAMSHRFRYKFYSKLAPATQHNALIMPSHVIPPSLFTFGWISEGSQSSLISILSIWNTMMGTSMLAMPWAIAQAGLALGCGSVILMMCITLFTCQIIVRHGEGGTINGQPVEFGDVIKIYLGHKAYIVSQCFSILTICGACMVYWVLMTGFLRNIVNFLVCHHESVENPQFCSIVPPPGPDLDPTLEYSSAAWNGVTIPIYLVLVLFPLMNLKNISFFTKLNALGVVSIIYLVGFILFTTFSNFPGSPFGGLHVEKRYHVELASPKAINLIGVLTLSYFIHNGSLSILRNARNPKNNARDLTIAYSLGCATYLTVGVCLYLSFRSRKIDIQQNFLDNFNVTAQSYVYAFIAQCFLLLQFFTVVPLLAYIVRFQTLTMICDGEAWPSVWHVVGLNSILVGMSISVTIWYPHIGNILRYCGSICGFVYVFAMPMLVDREVLRRKEEYTWSNALLVWLFISFGLANVVGQFLF